MSAIWEYTFSWLPSDVRFIILGFITFAFLIALIKFIKR